MTLLVRVSVEVRALPCSACLRQPVSTLDDDADDLYSGRWRRFRDEELIARSRLAPTAEDSRQLIDELFRRHRSRVIAWCHRLSGNRDLAPDLAQDVFIKAYSSLHTFRHDSRLTMCDRKCR